MTSPCGSVLAGVSGTIESMVARRAGGADRRLLDVGCWDGEQTLRYARISHAAPSGIEIMAKQAKAARDAGVDVAEVDLEIDRFPWGDTTFDIVIANQVLEHLKNVWLPMSEMWRVVKPDGIVLLSVPNLASLHNRVLMGLGRQPTSIRTIGPHVRGFTMREFVEFVRLKGALEVSQVRGVGFYPLSGRAAGAAARVWRGAAHTTVVVARRGPGVPAWREQTAATATQTHWSE